MKRVNHLYEILISDDNLMQAIEDVNRSHRYGKHHRPNKTVAYIEAHKQETVDK